MTPANSHYADHYSEVQDKLPTDGTRSGKLPFPAAALMVGLILPFLIQIGPMLMSVNRIVLTIMIIPCLLKWLRGDAGKILTADIALLLYSFWIMLSFTVIHGISSTLEASGINFIETMGAYLVARCYIRDADTFRAFVALFFKIIALMLPFAIYETLTGHNILLQIANDIWYSSGDIQKEPRWGFDRVQGLLSHPIFFGVVCGSAFALVYYVLGYGVSAGKRLFKTSVVGLAAALSLSSGPLTALVAQFALILWDRLLKSVKGRWTLLSGGILSLVVLVEIVANRSTAQIFIAYFAFNRSTAQNRLRIWEWGSKSVGNHPVFGIGRNDWVRLPWMSDSMDMFWLSQAVRNGLPAAILIQLAVFSLFLSIAFKSGLSKRVAQYRMGYLVCLVGLYLSGWTVDYWKNIYVLFMFVLGSGAWISEAAEQQNAPETAPGKSTTGPRRHTTATARPVSAHRQRQGQGSLPTSRKRSET